LLNVSLRSKFSNVRVVNLSEVKIGVVIPAFNASTTIETVLEAIPSFVSKVIVVVDACKTGTGEALARSNFSNHSRVTVLHNVKNIGVGGSTIRGMKYALEHFQLDVIVKIDADGQIDPGLIEPVVSELVNRDLDYIKGNRLNWERLDFKMPKSRLIANNLATLFFKISTGFWNLGDPANGLFGVQVITLRKLNLDSLKKRWFFESDMLGELAVNGAKVGDFPMKPVYGDEKSNVKLLRQVFPFSFGFARIFFKRVSKQYFINEMNFGSLSILFYLTNYLGLLTFATTTLLPKLFSNVPITSGQTGILIIFLLNMFYSFTFFFFYDFRKAANKQTSNG
jgi:dolichol-phosphate mannosyltransferase